MGDTLDTHTPMDTMDTMEREKLKQSLKLIPFIYKEVCMDIMDMLDTHTPMDTMDTMENVKLMQSLKLIHLIYMVVCMDITDMLDTHTPMGTMDTMESAKLMPMLIQFCSMVDMDTMDMLVTMDILDTPMYTT